MDRPEQFDNMLAIFDHMPILLVNFISRGYIGLSFFFLLSGFILAYHYRTPEGQISESHQRFWLLRFSCKAMRNWLVALLLCWVSLIDNNQFGDHQFYWATLLMLVLAIASSYLIEKPVARLIEKPVGRAIRKRIR